MAVYAFNSLLIWKDPSGLKGEKEQGDKMMGMETLLLQIANFFVDVTRNMVDNSNKNCKCSDTWACPCANDDKGGGSGGSGGKSKFQSPTEANISKSDLPSSGAPNGESPFDNLGRTGGGRSSLGSGAVNHGGIETENSRAGITLKDIKNMTVQNNSITSQIGFSFSLEGFTAKQIKRFNKLINMSYNESKVARELFKNVSDRIGLNTNVSFTINYNLAISVTSKNVNTGDIQIALTHIIFNEDYNLLSSSINLYHEFSHLEDFLTIRINGFMPNSDLPLEELKAFQIENEILNAFGLKINEIFKLANPRNNEVKVYQIPEKFRRLPR